MHRGRLYDGVTAHPFEVDVRHSPAGLDLSTEDGWSDKVAGALLKRIDGGKGTLRLGRSDIQGWRLVLPAAVETELAGVLGRPERYGRWIDRIGLLPAALIGGGLTILVVAIGYLAPSWIAPHVPMSWERNLGSAIVGDFGELRCRGAGGQESLDALLERVAPGASTGPDGIKLAALDVGMFNAAALPGGHVVVFKPAITEAEPEALAGILAHEVAHVRRRHVTQALVRELGIGALIRLFAGNIGANAEQIVALSYTRSNEAEADADAIAMLKRANIDPRPTAELFRRLSEETPQFSADFLQSHPDTGERAAAFDASFDRSARYTPALSDAAAAALFDICGQDKA